jgi:hypothetical protein
VLLDAEGPRAALPPAVDAVDCYQTAGSARMRRELVALRDRSTEWRDDSAAWDIYEALQSVA